MRIIIKDPVTAAETVLCDGPGRGLDRSQGPTDRMPVGRRINVQPLERARQTAKQFVSRFNAEHPISFSISRQAASAAAARVWYWNHLKNCLTAGTVIMSESAGGRVVTVTIADCVISDISGGTYGVHIDVTYQIQGGALTIT